MAARPLDHPVVVVTPASLGQGQPLPATGCRRWGPWRGTTWTCRWPVRVRGHSSPAPRQAWWLWPTKRWPKSPPSSPGRRRAPPSTPGIPRRRRPRHSTRGTLAAGHAAAVHGRLHGRRRDGVVDGASGGSRLPWRLSAVEAVQQPVGGGAHDYYHLPPTTAAAPRRSVRHDPNAWCRRRGVLRGRPLLSYPSSPNAARFPWSPTQPGWACRRPSPNPSLNTAAQSPPIRHSQAYPARPPRQRSGSTQRQPGAPTRTACSAPSPWTRRCCRDRRPAADPGARMWAPSPACRPPPPRRWTRTTTAAGPWWTRNDTSPPHCPLAVSNNMSPCCPPAVRSSRNRPPPAHRNRLETSAPPARPPEPPPGRRRPPPWLVTGPPTTTRRPPGGPTTPRWRETRGCRHCRRPGAGAAQR